MFNPVYICNLACSSRVDKNVDVHIVFVIINSQYVFAFVERPCAEQLG